MSKLDGKMKNIIEMINCKKIIILTSDKKIIYYLVTSDRYFMLMNGELNKQYKKYENSTVETKMNKNAKLVGERLGIDERLETLRKDESYLLLKNHKNSFYREKQARLINLIKNQLGIISTSRLDRAIAE